MSEQSQIVCPLPPAKALAFAAAFAILTACSVEEPDGYVYQMNGAGMTLPAAGAEVAFLPGKSRAEFFFEPLSKAYLYATNDLGTELAPACIEAKTLLEEQEEKIKSAQIELKNGGDLPTNPDTCLDMCTERVALEDRRGQSRRDFSATSAHLDSEIAKAVNQIKELRESRSEKAGILGRQLKTLEATRHKELQKKADQLLAEQLSKISFLIEPSQSWNRTSQVRVTLINGTDYAIKAARYGNNPVLEGYYQGHPIVTAEIYLPHYDVKNENRKDQFGFDMGFFLPSGYQVPVGVSISDFPGLNISSPEGRLMAKERRWNTSTGWILPDEIRIKSFSPSLFVFPDTTGSRSGSTITYNPRPVDFRAQAEALGVAQDEEITKLKRQIDAQAYPEDSEISVLLALIDDLQKQKKEANERFMNSPIAAQINQLISSERSCRTARDRFNELESASQKLASIQANLSSCGSKSVDSVAIFKAVSDLNKSTGAEIRTPDISERYRTKAGALVMTKLAKYTEATTLTSIDGSYSIPAGVDQDSHLVLVDSQFSLGKSFWLQPLSSLGDRKDLAPNTAQSGQFEDYIEDVISAGIGVGSPDELAFRLAIWNAGEQSPYYLSSNFEASAKAMNLKLEALEAKSEDSESNNSVDEKLNPPSSCAP